MAALWVRIGLSPSFVATSDEKTPGMVLHWKDTTVHVECTQRDPYVPLPRDRHAEGPTTRLLNSLRSRQLAGLEVIVIALSSLEDADVPAILADVQRVERDTTGSLGRRTPYGVYVRKLPPPTGDGYWMGAPGASPPYTLDTGIFLPAGQNPAWAEATVAVDASGRKTLTGHYRVYVHIIDSHDLQALVESFSRKRKQIPKDGQGIIFVDVDVSHVAVEDISLYLDLVAEGLKRCFTPTINTRIAAIVLTTKPVPIETTDETGHKFIVLRSAIRAVRNEYSRLPSDFVLPGES